jgi:mutator protein MutT
VAVPSKKLKPIAIVIPYRNDRDQNYQVWCQIRHSSDELNGLKEFPGGKIELSESPEEAAKREVLEEASVELTMNDLEPFKLYTFQDGLLIRVFLYNDKRGLFERANYISLMALCEQTELIPPNNLEILEDLIKYFQEFRV